MAKKSQVPPAPAMTALPITNGDSPLVIDLPDGQKLVVGSLAAGSVIEVATWRGTGRPDSRTSRLMLGMSSAAQQPATAAQGEEKKSAPSLISNLTEFVKALVLKVPSLVKAKKKKSPAEKRESAPLIEKVVPAAKSSNSAEVDDWLNSILEKSAKKSAAQKSVEVSEEKPAAKKAVVKAAAKKKAAPKKKPTGRTR